MPINSPALPEGCTWERQPIWSHGVWAAARCPLFAHHPGLLGRTRVPLKIVLNIENCQRAYVGFKNPLQTRLQ